MTTVLNTSELTKIHTLLSGDGGTKESLSKKERSSYLAKKSASRAQKWPNTLENSRAQKLRARQKRLDEIERKARELDLEEAKYRRQEREAKIKRAKEMIYNQKDNVKEFNSIKLLSEVNAERRKQIQIKKKIKADAAQQDMMYHKMQTQIVKRMEAREKQDMEDRFKRAKQFAKAQKQQLAAHRRRQEKSRQEEAEEGRRNLALAKKVVQEAEEARVKKIELIKRKNIAKVLENKRLIEMRKELKLKELEELKKIEEFATKKEKQLAERKRVQEEKFRKKQEIRQKMIDDQTRRLEEILKAEKDLISLQVTERRKKEDEDEKMKEDKRNKLMADIHTSRQQQLRAKHQRREEELKHDKILAKHSRQRVKEIVEIEKQERMAVFKKNKEHQEFLLSQQKEKRARQIAGLRKQLKEDRLRFKKMNDDEVGLEKHIAGLRKSMKDRGCDMRPIDIMQMKKKGKTPFVEASWPGPL
mmetsp:Transcript_31021/g.54449  ORF Transcript_31021/g.54449 Transcript_31021/m.54449 type:complete len:473 (+) Transcript_31021:157-1575(+)|eukprot:CAMPEP_0197526276 /NCGR_PEP_ID=MMETSP1318-20131121/17108_1 /TAXON_ID=552666 /ORGANISM="Partenskyella glossopodia, Strain RCC365" /LENGTH=472 /DNA_ID=CAMNT_0043080373 /DNA_START=95 /DNA_END=1513 /DNA_ORIENTATION=+